MINSPNVIEFDIKEIRRGRGNRWSTQNVVVLGSQCGYRRDVMAIICVQCISLNGDSARLKALHLIAHPQPCCATDSTPNAVGAELTPPMNDRS